MTPGPSINQFESLLPELILSAVEQQGLQPTGYFLQLNSYENRVYEIGLEEQAAVVAKFYRPSRWDLSQLAEEHAFVSTLVAAEIGVVAPLSLHKPYKNVPTIGHVGSFYYALYPKFRGREQADLSLEDRRQLGRFMGRMHNVGAAFRARYRLPLDPQTYGDDQITQILKQECLPGDLLPALEASLHQVMEWVRPAFTPDITKIPLHGDCHLGNILWNQNGPHLVDFDDMVLAPPIQDVWMLLSGDREEVGRQQEAFFEGYELFRRFDYRTFKLIEPLRTLRMIRHAAWIGARYYEPIFQRAFPYYRDRRYWEEFLLSIKEQIALVQEARST